MIGIQRRLDVGLWVFNIHVRSPQKWNLSKISLLSRLQPFSATGNTKNEARQKCKMCHFYCFAFLSSCIFRLCQLNPQHGITMGPPNHREGHNLMQTCLLIQCLSRYFSSCTNEKHQNQFQSCCPTQIVTVNGSHKWNVTSAWWKDAWLQVSK